MKPVFAALLNAGDNKAFAYLLASVVAGAVAALLLCPMESTRIKMVTDPAYAHDNLLSALGRLAATEGLGASFGGLWAMLSKQVPYTFGKQVSFDVFAGFLYAFFGALQQKLSALNDGSIKWAVSVFAAAAASLVACIFSQPGDMILTETYKPKKAAPVASAPIGVSAESDVASVTDTAVFSSDSMASIATTPPQQISTEQSSSSMTSAVSDGDSVATADDATAYASTTATAVREAPPAAVAAPAPVKEEVAKVSTAFADVVSRLYREGGVAKFFTGTQARIVHVGLIITSQLVVYDIVKQMLGLPATGSH